MFLDFYGFREQPFGTNPNPKYMYPSEVHREALASLIYGIESDLGFGAVIADPGMGKTTLLFSLLQKYEGKARTAILLHPECDSADFLRYLMLEFGVRTAEREPVQLREQFKELVVKEAVNRRRVLVMVDEAQGLQTSVLESLRLLSNFETPKGKLLHIVLAGQLQLAERLSKPDMAQLVQRIPIISRLRAFSRQETGEYIEHRLQVAGYTGRGLFTSEAVDEIAAISEGIPRQINAICFNALSLACVYGAKVVGSEIIREVAADRQNALSAHVSGGANGKPTGRVEKRPEDQRIVLPADSDEPHAPSALPVREVKVADTNRPAEAGVTSHTTLSRATDRASSDSFHKPQGIAAAISPALAPKLETRDPLPAKPDPAAKKPEVPVISTAGAPCGQVEDPPGTAAREVPPVLLLEHPLVSQHNVDVPHARSFKLFKAPASTSEGNSLLSVTATVTSGAAIPAEIDSAAPLPVADAPTEATRETMARHVGPVLVHTTPEIISAAGAVDELPFNLFSPRERPSRPEPPEFSKDAFETETAVAVENEECAPHPGPQAVLLDIVGLEFGSHRKKRTGNDGANLDRLMRHALFLPMILWIIVFLMARFGFDLR